MLLVRVYRISIAEALAMKSACTVSLWTSASLTYCWTKTHSLGCNSNFSRRECSEEGISLGVGFNIDGSRSLIALHDELGEPVEEAPFWFFVGLLAVGVAIAAAEHRTITGDLEADDIVRGGHMAASAVEHLHAHDGDVFAVRVYLVSVCR